MEFLIIFMVFVCVVTLGLAISNLFARRPEQQRLARLGRAGRPAPPRPTPAACSPRTSRGWLTRFVQRFAGEKAVDESDEEGGVSPVRRRLIYAGYRRESAFVTYMGSRVVLALGLPVLLLVFPPIWSLEHLQLVVAMVCAAGVGLIAPSSWLDRRMKARQKELQLALPDALDLMVVCVEAGLGINASLKRVADDFATALIRSSRRSSGW